MSTVRGYLKVHHGALEKYNHAVAKDHRALAEEYGEDSSLGKLHASLAQNHEAIAEHHKSMSQELGTVTDTQAVSEPVPAMTNAQPYVDLGTRKSAYADLTPDHIRGVIPAPPYGSAVTMITRPGQPSAPEKPNVPIEFEHLVKIEDDLWA